MRRTPRIVVRTSATRRARNRYRISLADGLLGQSSFQLLGKRYVMSGHDRAVVRFLDGLGDRLRGAEQAGQRLTLLQFRDDFQAIIENRPIPGLVLTIHFAPRQSRRIAVWLLGRIGNRQTVSVVSLCTADPDVATRRAAVQALRRLSAWAMLRRIAVQERDPVIRRLAAAAERPPADFSDRLARYVRHDVDGEVRESEEPATRISLEVNAQPGSGLPPKTSWFIRRILEHIRWLVGRDPPAQSWTPLQKGPKAP